MVHEYEFKRKKNDGIFQVGNLRVVTQRIKKFLCSNTLEKLYVINIKLI
jgi:hypothetical protein